MSSKLFGEFKRKEVTPDISRAVDAVADQAGFRKRSAPSLHPRRQRNDREVFSLTMKLYIEDANDFVQWCDQERLTYRDGFNRLMEAMRGRGGD